MNNKNILTFASQDKLNYLKILDSQIKDELKNGKSFILASPDGLKIPAWMEEKFRFVYV